jgi:hypothetical protein
MADSGLKRKTSAAAICGGCGVTVVPTVENSKSTTTCAPEHCHDGTSVALLSMILAFSSLSILASVLKLPNKTFY